MNLQKEILKFIGDKAVYDESGQMIFARRGKDLQMLLNVRGWGAIQNLFKNENDAAAFQDAIGEWIADAINQKLEKQTK